MRFVWLGLLSLLLWPAQVVAAPASSNWIGVGSGVGYSRIGPAAGIPLAAQYGRRLGCSNLWLTVQGDITLNADRPMGMLMKGSAGGLEVGTEWHSGPLEQAHFYSGATIGPRVYAEPGAGMVAHAVVGGVLPIRDRLAIFVQGRGGIGIVRVGDDLPRTRTDVTVDGIVGLRVNF